jgi:hypothetical protein
VTEVYHRTSQPLFFKWTARPVKGLKCPSAGKFAKRTFVPGFNDATWLIARYDVLMKFLLNGYVVWEKF